MVTGDQDYMDKFGYELIFDTARFWVSRLEDKNRQIHEIDLSKYKAQDFVKV